MSEKCHDRKSPYLFSHAVSEHQPINSRTRPLGSGLPAFRGGSLLTIQA
jgi:hypothetical protein